MTRYKTDSILGIEYSSAAYFQQESASITRFRGSQGTFNLAFNRTLFKT